MCYKLNKTMIICFVKITQNVSSFQSNLSMTKSPKYKLARFLYILLELVLNHYSRFFVKDSFEVIEHIRNINLENRFLCSFYVKKLFKNVPLDEFIQICGEMLYSLKKLSIKKTSFLKLMKIAASNVQLSFNTKFIFKQAEWLWGLLLGLLSLITFKDIQNLS